MTPRVDLYDATPALTKQFIDFSNAVYGSGLEESLLDLVEIRASQINGCANCLNMHTSEARKKGETEQRLHLLAAWHEAPVYSERERAALAWTEHLTLLPQSPDSDDVYEQLDAQFSKEEQAKLTMLINIINSWNRLAVGFQVYVPSLGWEGGQHVSAIGV
jgi:AhpD family alkylhydroperoxidase